MYSDHNVRMNEIILPSPQGPVLLRASIHYQLLPEDLVSQSIERGEGSLADSGALLIDTGEFTGRAPQDRFIVRDDCTRDVHWNHFNQPIDPGVYERLYSKILLYLEGKELWVRDAWVGAREKYRLPIRVLNENACCNLFAYNMFLRPQTSELPSFQPAWHLIQVPHFFADPAADGVPRRNFVIINFSARTILVGGTQYTGEMKKAVFTIMNYLLPVRHRILTMHGAANRGPAGDTAIFFGLSGTGKTTLSADDRRELIGDDEHGWDADCIFNLEGGCYAKTIRLDAKQEPHIYRAIRFGSLVENVPFRSGTNVPDYASARITENTRASYPIDYIGNAVVPSVGKTPSHIFFLTADAFGVIPPLSRLDPAQAMYYFLSGYTARIAGTEAGVVAPKPTFSACFGAPFLPLHPYAYAELLGEKLKGGDISAWMVNTGWTGGKYGSGSRIPLEHTRAMIRAVLHGDLENVPFRLHEVFRTMVPRSVPGVPDQILLPEDTWDIREKYFETAHELANYFCRNFEQYARNTGRTVRQAGPVTR